MSIFREKQTLKEIQIAIDTAGKDIICFGGQDCTPAEARRLLSQLKNFCNTTYYNLIFDIGISDDALHIFNPVFIR